MYRPLIALLALIVSLSVSANDGCFPDDVLPENMFPVLEFVTNKGTIEVELNRNRAPVTVNNFLRYVLDEHYANTIFHRVIADFVVQWRLHPRVCRKTGSRAGIERIRQWITQPNRLHRHGSLQ